jgi:chitodextrinase
MAYRIIAMSLKMQSTPADNYRRSGRGRIAVAQAQASAQVVTIQAVQENGTYGPGGDVSRQAYQANMQYTSSEWVMEAPSGSKGVLPLDNFTSVSSTSASAWPTGTGPPVGRR